MGWSDRNCMQKFLLVFAVITACVILAIFIASLVECIQYKCDSCSVQTKAFYYILRIYTMVFAILGILAEFPRFKFFQDSLKIFRYFWGRGFLHVFLAFLTLAGQQDLNSGSEGENIWVDIIGYVMLGFGVAHFILSCICFQPYKREGEDASEGSYTSA